MLRRSMLILSASIALSACDDAPDTLPGGLEVIERTTISSVAACTEKAKAYQKRPEVVRVEDQSTSTMYSAMLVLNDDTVIIQLCHEVGQGKVIYTIGKAPKKIGEMK